MKWAIEQAPPMPAQLVATLAGLANHADPKGRGAYPSLSKLAAYTCKAERSVRRDLRQLEELGLIRRGDPSKVAHLSPDRRPEVYDLAMERTVPGGRAGSDEGTQTSARSLASARARGGRKKPSSDEYRADVDVRGDVGVRADVDVTSGGTPTSQRGDAHVTSGGTWTSAKPSVEPSRNHPLNRSVVDQRETTTGSRRRATERTLSLITPDWQPTTTDREAAAADIRRLGAASTAAATAKFVRHHRAKGTTAADFGPLWQSWLARERPEPQQGAFLVGLPGGNTTPPTPTPPSFRQRMAQLDAAAEADRHRDRQTGEAG